MSSRPMQKISKWDSIWNIVSFKSKVLVGSSLRAPTALTKALYIGNLLVYDSYKGYVPHEKKLKYNNSDILSFIL